MNKLIPVNSREITRPPNMSLLLEVDLKPTVIIKSQLILVSRKYDFSLNKSFDWQRQMQFNTWTGLSAIQMLYQSRSRISLQTAVQFRNSFTFLLTHKFGTACSIEMVVESDEWSELIVLRHQSNIVLGQEHQSLACQEFLHVHELSQSLTDHNWKPLQSREPQHHLGFVVAESNHSWWYLFRSPINW